MVDRIGKGSGLAHEAILAALRSQARKTADVRAQIAASPATAAASALDAQGVEGTAGFSEQLRQGIDAVDAKVREAEGLPEAIVSGQVDDFHEVAVQLKQAEISFRFAMEVRNKLIDAYREVMRMNL